MEIKKRRPGGGRKKSDPTVVMSFRIKEDVLTICRDKFGNNLASKVNEVLSSLAASN